MLLLHIYVLKFRSRKVKLRNVTQYILQNKAYQYKYIIMLCKRYYLKSSPFLVVTNYKKRLLWHHAKSGLLKISSGSNPKTHYT